MALRTGFVKTYEIPHEPGETMDLRALGWKDLDEARRARTADAFKDMRQMGKELYSWMQDAQSDAPARATGDALNAYDLATLLRLGIAGWSYGEDVSPETIGQLDPVTAEWAARVIIGEQPESEAERKNDSARSTTP